MDEQTSAPKKEVTPDQALQRQIRKMSDKQMSRRINRIARTTPHNLEAAIAIVFAQVLDNTKPLGRMEPFLR